MGTWQRVGTGGSCTAWEHTMPDGSYWLLTDDNMGAPAHDYIGPTLLGHYDAEGEQLSCDEYPSAAAARAAFAARL